MEPLGRAVAESIREEFATVEPEVEAQPEEAARSVWVDCLAGPNHRREEEAAAEDCFRLNLNPSPPPCPIFEGILCGAP